MSKKERDQLWANYKASVKLAGDRHRLAVERAGNVYHRGIKALNKADAKKLADLAGGATVGKPPRSKADGTRSRS
jgi:hypothetical protein